jgi:hypothetical protein
VIYDTDFGDGTNGWGGTKDWHREGGDLQNKQEIGQSVIYSPITLPGGQNYAIETHVRFMEVGYYGAVIGFTFKSPGTTRDGTGAEVPIEWRGVGYPVLDGNWHSYRIEVVGSHVTFWIDDHYAGDIDDSNYQRQARIGLFTVAACIEVRRFTVYGITFG